MDIEEIKKKLNQDKKNNNPHKYANNLITRTLLASIVFLLVIILYNKMPSFKSKFTNLVLENNISFTKINNLYTKYFGEVLPVKKLKTEEVFNEKLTYEKIENYQNGYTLSVTNNYPVPVINSGIVVFIGEKEGYGSTIIVQGIDEIDYWYGNVTNESVKLYDYVSKGNILATSIDDKLYLVLQKNGEYLDFDEVNKKN